MKLDVTIKQERKKLGIDLYCPLDDLTSKSLYIDSEIVSSVAWSADSQLLSCGDDKVVCKWGADGEKSGKISTLTVFPSSAAWFPASGKQV